MSEERALLLKKMIEEIRLSVDKKTAVHLGLDKCIRIVERLDEFADDCEVCQEHFHKLEEQLTEVAERKGDLTKEEIKNHYQMVERISKHLQEQHKLISNNYYMSIYMSIGLSVGLLFGLVIFDNIALGLPIGMILGMAVGNAKDKEAEKKGKVI